jgi:hypothetical protein
MLAPAMLSAARFQTQDPPLPGRGAAPDAPVVTPAEVQKMFEAVALVKSQDALKLPDDRYLPFLAKFKVLQDVRRRTLQERNRLMRELNRVANDATIDEAAVKERMKMLLDLDARSEVELHKAYEGIDQVLDPRQQARFRLFEEQMERQKIDLLMRARIANRQQKRDP